MKLAAEGKLDLDEKLVCRPEDKLPPCGALVFLTCPMEVEIRSLCAQMISLSDNTAANLLIRRFGLDFLNRQFREIGLEKTHFERLLFDGEAAARGLENRIVPEEIGGLLARIARREFVSPELSRAMVDLLLEQQINHKLVKKSQRGLF